MGSGLDTAHSRPIVIADDDLLHVVDEPVPETLAQLARIFTEPMSPLVPYYRPIPRLLNVAQKWLHGADPIAFHALNLQRRAGTLLGQGE